ncbi:MATE family efflux transporter [Acetatifactor muris]|uniref:Multidrug export protein MepA n=1 Tax=Acetatifactor muris TaxID=879566 RepID=A0A2K4ZID4_9FIRM|nr:MATE family efflux transporter [Acetatifactor muris]MCI8798595.1 MATE family efflux transporter [Lachnospiraceae bacterium]MCR2048420.1 MATE family efflux transporter [Acetatifactor muris]SOY30224.1 Multidrug export protein MepA [Acetatifactor muris]
MKIQLSDHFNYGKLLRFTLPSIIMMIFTSIYGVVDGFFVSNFVGKTPFAAVNFIMPFLMILGAIGFMFGTGGSAIIAITMGAGEKEKAQRLFSLFVYLSFGCGIVIAVLGIVFIRPVGALLGAEGVMLDNCVLYGRIILAALPAFILQYEFQSFFITAEKPQLGLAVTVAAGVSNMVLDAVFVGVFRWGLVGAAAATAFSQLVGGIVPVVYFLRPNTSLLRLTRTKYDGRALLKACTNGSSELMSSISMSIVGMLYNAQLMKYAGEDGVAAYGVLMYVSMIFLAVFIGYSVGVAPVISYHYGAGNHGELKGLLRKSLILVGTFSVGMVALGEVLARPLSMIFVGYDQGLLELTLRGFLVYSFSFLFAGLAIYGSSFFTALGNGLVSALISFLRTLVFQMAAVLLLPLIWGIDGIWVSIVAAELMAAVVTILFLVGMKGKYHY